MTDLLPVAQADRDAAKIVERAAHALWPNVAEYICKLIDEGRRDNTIAVQAFAAHRIRSSPPLSSDRMEGFRAGIKAAAKVCDDVEQAAAGQGHALGRPRPSANVNGHRSGEIRLGAARCASAIRALSDDEEVG